MSEKLPLAVDLDGTLIHGDIFSGWKMRLLLRTPWKLPLLLWWLAHGRAFAKARLAELFPLDASALPYDARVVAWLRAERASGRTIVLATAIDRGAADAVARHLGLFDAVLASDGRTNLKSRRKAAALAAAFPDGFVYAGNEGADLRVWAAARAAVIVNTPRRLADLLRRRHAIEAEFPRHSIAKTALLDT